MWILNNNDLITSLEARNNQHRNPRWIFLSIHSVSAVVSKAIETKESNQYLAYISLCFAHSILLYIFDNAKIIPLLLI